MFTIPLKQSESSTSLAYTDNVDAQYNIYNASLGLFNIPNSFNDGTNVSQWKFGLLGVAGRYQQNIAWNAQYAISTVSGVSALNIFATTYVFNRDIYSVDSGKIKCAIIREFTNSFLTINHTTNAINTALWTVAWPQNIRKKMWVATNTNNYLVWIDTSNNLVSYACNANWAIQSATPTQSVAIPFQAATGQTFSIWTNYVANISAVKDNYIWVVLTQVKLWYNANINDAEATCTWLLYSISSSWQFTLIHTNAKFVNVFASANQNSNNTWQPKMSWSDSYIHNNTCYVLAHAWSTSEYYNNQGWWYRILFSINLSVTATFNVTEIKKDQRTWFSQAHYYPNTNDVHFGYDVWNSIWYFVTNEGSRDIMSVTSSAFSTTWFSYRSNANNIAYYPRYTHNLTVLRNVSNNANIAFVNNALVIRANTSNGTLSNLFSISYFVYEATGTNNQSDDSFMLWMQVPAPCIWSATWSDKVFVEINWTEVSSSVVNTTSNSINTLWTIMYNSSLIIPKTELWVWNKTVKIKLWYTNIFGISCKLWFGITWWTYATPTWTNDHSGSSTAWSSIWTNWSQIDITMS